MPKRTGAIDSAAVERVLQPDAIRNETMLRAAREVGLREGELSAFARASCRSWLVCGRSWHTSHHISNSVWQGRTASA
jgi:hypothetical protein